MLLTISGVLENDDLHRLRKDVSNFAWRDGKKTAGKTASGVKHNEQLDLNSAKGRALQETIIQALSKNPVLAAAARPRQFSNLLISRTHAGGRYGPHIDNALMRKGGARLRTDLSFTLFLSDPDQYDGGELIVHSAGAAQSLKGNAGDLVLYPSSSIHEVAQVKRGARLVCAGWIESVIADVAQRELLFDLQNLRVSLSGTLPAQSAELLTLDKTIANLLRMWAKP
ncbi:MAG: Fe2+-dependent dioxygenase [Pseudomonadota bacterium]